MVQSTGVITPPPPHKFDKNAHAELARLAGIAREAFKQNALDRALDRLIAHSTRKQSGQLLAQRLFRDAQKYLKIHLKSEFVTDELETESRSADSPTPLQLYEIREAVFTIRNGLMRLTVRERQVFLTRMTDDAPDALGVGERWFRTLLTDARSRLLQQDEMEEARTIVMHGLGRWRWEIIDLLAPLSECLAPAN